MLGRDGWTGLICLLGSLGLLWLTRGLPQPALVPIGPAFYPRIVLAVSAVLAALLLVTDLWSRRRAAADGVAGAPGRRDYGRVALTFAVFAAYVLLMPALGYRVSTFLFVLGLQATLEPAWLARSRSPDSHIRSPRLRLRLAPPLLRFLIAAAATAFLTHLVFENYLSVLLPRGRWTGF